ncbi:hypothetical protein NP493_856g00001 [Ridgeia piscesae]|uniref:Uncharacterized protein n=1 Tax=Ridgeia piscesae TaxID=27915 RepID=A0AAD9KLA5_RIDPI|nr:hypothetical protein NP493_856g00001 [Ridgeia piscesae]
MDTFAKSVILLAVVFVLCPESGSGAHVGPPAFLSHLEPHEASQVGDCVTRCLLEFSSLTAYCDKMNHEPPWCPANTSADISKHCNDLCFYILEQKRGNSTESQ